MKIKVLGVAHFPQKDKFKVIYDGNKVNSDRMKTYGVNPREIWGVGDLYKTFTENIGKEVNVSFDVNRNIDTVTY